MRRILLVILGGVACTGSSEHRASNAVLETAIRSFGPIDGTGETAFLDDSTLVLARGLAGIGGKDFEWTVGAAPDEYQTAVRAALAETRPARPLDRRLRLPPNLRWGTGADTGSRLTRYRISNVGFSADSTRAAVYVEYWCGALCAGGAFYFYRLSEPGVWERDGAVPVFSV